MKMNWGTSILLAFVLFMSFIMYFVVKVQSNSKYDNELVVEEYYKHDAHFQEEMVKIQNAQDLTAKPVIKYTDEGLSVVFPEAFLAEKIQGKVSLYRPSDKRLDFEVPISSSNATLLIPKKSLAGGRWDITIEWKYEGKEYISKQQFNF